MTDPGETSNRALLPPGFTDTLAPNAARESGAVSAILGHFAAHGFSHVKPPLVEFEETLFGGIGAAKREQSFRVMDPVSHRMLAIRPDMTVQIARMAASRLASAPRPLRLSYAGQVLRVTADNIRPERQFTQLGAEIIGADGEQADSHIISLAVHALDNVGIAGVTVDLTLPDLVGCLVPELAHPEDRDGDFARAVESKDVGAVAAMGGEAANLLVGLIDAGGPADEALAAAGALALPEDARAQVDRMSATVALLRSAIPDTPLTVDFVERRGFEYQTGVGFTLFARSLREELGRGGGYVAGAEFGEGEHATGVSLYMDSILRGLPRSDAPTRVLVPADLPARDAEALHRQGFVTVYALSAGDPEPEEAGRTGCAHLFVSGKLHPLEG